MSQNTKISSWSSFTRPLRKFTAFLRGARLGVDHNTPLSSFVNEVDFGVQVNNSSAFKLSAFFAGIRLISENIASLPKSVKVEDADGARLDREHPINHLLHSPNGYTNSMSFWMTIVTWIKGWGNAYAIIKRNPSGIPVELHQVHPSNVTIKFVNGKKWYKVAIMVPEFEFLNGVYSDDDMLHFMELSYDGIVGVNPVVNNAIALGKSLAQEKFAGEFYKKGGNIKAVMETDGSLGDDQYAQFLAHMSSAAGNFDTPLLEYGIKYKQLSVNPVAAQLIQSETMSIQDIARILNVPPHMIAELSHATFSNIEHQTIQFVQYSLRPVVRKIEIELENKLFFAKDHGVLSIKFSLDGLLRGDTNARSAFYHNAILDGYMSRNEVRSLEGLPHVDGLDKFLVPLNVAEVGEDGEIINQE